MVLSGSCTCQPRLQTSYRHDGIFTCFAHCRAAVSLFRVLFRMAQWPSHCAPSLGTQLHMCALTLKSSHCPDGKNADTLASILACKTAADALVNYSMCVPQRPSKLPIAPMGKCLLTCPFRFSSLMTGAASIYQFGVRAICA